MSKFRKIKRDRDHGLGASKEDVDFLVKEVEDLRLEQDQFIEVFKAVEDTSATDQGFFQTRLLQIMQESGRVREPSESLSSTSIAKQIRDHARRELAKELIDHLQKVKP